MNVNVICDLQFGSCGKGLIAGYLAKRTAPDTLVTAWGPNAGHTWKGDGHTMVHCMLANGVVSPGLERIMIAPASQINLQLLAHELDFAKDYLIQDLPMVKLIIHENAALIQQWHVDQESGSCGEMTKIGSTKKGCGACAIEKIKRAVDNRLVVGANRELVMQALAHLPIIAEIVDTADWVRHMAESKLIQVEGSQGFSLGINSGFYPYTTSRECTPAQILSDCLISPNQVGRIIGAMRTFPIRVSNRYNERGDQIGWSGPCYPDQREITWEMLGIAPEFTTVTQLQRRVFTHSMLQFELALSICRPTDLFINFLNQIPNPVSSDVGYSAEDFITALSDKTRAVLGHDLSHFYGWGPDDSQVCTLDSHPVED